MRVFHRFTDSFGLFLQAYLFFFISPDDSFPLKLVELYRNDRTLELVLEFKV